MYRNENKNEKKSIHSTIIETGADIVLIQEDTFPLIRSSNGIIVEGYERVIQCKTHPSKRNSIGNSILVSNKYLKNNSILNTKAIDVTEGCPTKRCAVFAEFDNGLSIVNTHFCGGKYDDRSFANNQPISDSITGAKNEALHKMWRVFGNFTIIGGDFNGMNNQSYNLQLFESYPLYQQMNITNQKQFALFFQTPHVLLRQNGYYPSYDERMVNKTAQIGPQINVPDWIYISSQLKHFVKRVNVFDTILSDHNPVTVSLQLTTNNSANYELLLDGYYVLHSTVLYDFKCIQQISHIECNGMNEQIFLIKQHHSNDEYHTYYTIQSNHSKLYWTMSASMLSEEKYNGFDNQMFEFIPYKTDTDTYNIKTKESGKYLCVSNKNSVVISQHLPKNENNQFIIYQHLIEKRRIQQRESVISVEECIENIPLLQTFIEKNIIDSTQAIYFPRRQPQEIANYTTLGYNKNVPSNAIKFVIDIFNNTSNASVMAYHGVAHPNSYDGILLKREGLKGRIYHYQKSLQLDLMDLGPIVFITPSYILASTQYATLYAFEDYFYSITLQVKVDSNKVIKIFHNTVPGLKNIDPNISDEQLEWVYRGEDIKIVGLIVKKYKKEELLLESFLYWRKWKLDGLRGYV